MLKHSPATHSRSAMILYLDGSILVVIVVSGFALDGEGGHPWATTTLFI